MTKNWNRPMSEQSKTRVINGLIDMRRAGIYHAVYCDGDLLSVLLPVTQYKKRLTWQAAAELVTVHYSKPTKPVMMQIRRLA